MIDGKTKQKLLDEIQKIGNVYLSCLKLGVDKATYYRWKQNNKKFCEKADEAERIGRSNFSDVAENYLFVNVKKGNQRAIEYALNHNSEIYKHKTDTNVYMYHKKEPPLPPIPQKTFEDLFDEAKQRRENSATELYEKYSKSVLGMPNKPDGTPISVDEVSSYSQYIENWQQERLKEFQDKGLFTKM